MGSSLNHLKEQEMQYEDVAKAIDGKIILVTGGTGSFGNQIIIGVKGPNR